MKPFWISTAALGLGLSACSSSSSTSHDTDSGAVASNDSGSSLADSGATTTPDDSGGSTPVDSGAGTPVDSGAPAPTNAAKLVLNVPASYTGTPRQLVVAAFASLPVAGPPAGILYQVNSPKITAGQSLTIEGDATGVSGSYYVTAVLYMVGGGTFNPTPGVDYAAESTSKVTFTGGPVDLGTLTLGLAPDGGL